MSREAFEAWALRNASLPSAHDIAWAAWQAALAQQQAEPIAWGMLRADGLVLDVICPEGHAAYEGEYKVPLYATPQQAQPAAPAVQPLSGDQIMDGFCAAKNLHQLVQAWVAGVQFAEQAHGIAAPGSDKDCTPNHLCKGRMVHLPHGEQCDRCGHE